MHAWNSSDTNMEALFVTSVCAWITEVSKICSSRSVVALVEVELVV